MAKPRILRRRLLCRTPYFTVLRVDALLPRGRRRTYYVTEHGARVGVLVLKGSAVLLVRQYRFLAGRPCWEIPGGAIEKGETPRTAARRECLEEAGLRCRRLRPLLTFMPSNDTLSNRTHLFIGSEPSTVARVEGLEVDRTGWFPYATCLEWIRKGRISDALSIVALLALRGSPALRTQARDR